MAPGRRQKHAKTIKSASTYVHAATSASSQSNKQEQLSVRERIDYLRRVQTPRLSTQDVQNESPATFSRSQERMRPASRVAGPRPPRSWTDGPVNFKIGSSSEYVSERRPTKLEYFPGVVLPPVTSLLHQSMKALAVNFEWHREYDHSYLSVLPVRQKSLLLRYIAFYGPYNGIEVNDLRLLFSSPHELDLLSDSSDYSLQPDATGCEELDCLDLGGSIGREALLKQLDKYWTKKSQGGDPTPEQWDNSGDTVPTGSPRPGIHSSLRFPSLVKLSLAYPGRNTSWIDFLNFSRHLGALTHLSLANWPTPRVSTTVFNVASAGLDNGISISDPANAELDEAVDALHQLSRNTPSLQYLSLAACERWYRALRHVSTLSSAPPPPRSARRIVREFDEEIALGGGISGSVVTTQRFVDFAGPWRHVTHLDLKQSTLPSHLDLRRIPNLLVRRSGPSRFSIDVSEFDAARLSEMAWWRHHDLRRGVQHARGVGGDLIGPTQYQIIAPNAGVAEQMKQRARVRVWFEKECDALDAGWFVKALRLGGKGKAIEVEHGWGKQDFLDLGYTEADLFEAGF